MGEESLRRLPRMDALLERAGGLLSRWSRPVVAALLREVLERARADVRAGAPPPDAETLLERAERTAARALAPSVVSAVNATGTVLHTGLGRSPLPPGVVEEICALADGYCVLEVDRQTGKRTNRIGHLASLLVRLFDVEAALAVNNDAAAVMLALATLASGGEVIVSRGELVEIGGSFRLPEIIAAAGVRLVEVGTTNRTYLSDYERAMTTSTAALLKVHPSNYRMSGYTEDVPLRALAELADGTGLPLIYDLGSGAVSDVGEPTVWRALEAGPSLLTFSGDKLFGACQAGIILGRRALVERINRNPLYRACRLDKLKIAILERAAVLYLAGAEDAFATLSLIRQSPKAAARRARRLARRLRARGVAAEVKPSQAEVGGGTMPEVRLPSFAVEIAVEDGSEERLARRLRLGEPAVFSRVRENTLVLDMFCVFDRQLSALADAVAAAFADETP